jgi:hypothetical protein
VQQHSKNPEVVPEILTNRIHSAPAGGFPGEEFDGAFRGVSMVTNVRNWPTEVSALTERDD